MKSFSLPVNILGVALLLAVWQICGAGLGSALLATPLEVAPAIAGTLADAHFWSALLATLVPMLAGYVLAMLVGVPLGIAMGRSEIIFAVVRPWASMCIVLSVAALVPLFIIVIGRGSVFLVGIVFFATVWYVVATMSEAARHVSPRLLAVAASFNASRFQSARYVILPALTTYVLIAARIGLIHALRAIVTAEMFIGAGYGGLLNDAGLELSTASLFALIVVLMAISLGATGLLRVIARCYAPWHESC